MWARRKLPSEKSPSGFRFSLPSACSTSAIISGMPFDVLVVDDDPWFRAVAARLLKSAGFNIAGEADTARRAVAAVIDLSPAAVLLDVGLPDGDGVSVATELSALATPPLIVL